MIDIEKIKEFVDKESKSDDKMESPPNTHYEAYAMIFREVEEVKFNMRNISLLMGRMWEIINRDGTDSESLDRIEYAARQASVGLINVISMCRQEIDRLGEISDE